MKEYEFWILWLMSIVMQLQIQIINKRLETIKQSYNTTGKKIEWQIKSQKHPAQLEDKNARKKPKNIYFSMYSNYWKGKCENSS